MKKTVIAFGLLISSLTLNAQSKTYTKEQLAKLWIVTEYNTNGQIQKMTGESRHMTLKPNGAFDNFADPVDGKGRWLVKGNVLILRHYLDEILGISKTKNDTASAVNKNKDCAEIINAVTGATFIFEILEATPTSLKLKLIDLNNRFSKPGEPEFNMVMTLKSY